MSGSPKVKPFNMGMQLLCSMDTKIWKEKNIKWDTCIFGDCSAQIDYSKIK